MVRLSFDGALDSKETVNGRMMALRKRGVEPVTINSYLRVVNAFFRWCHLEHKQALIRIPKLKVETKILLTFSAEQVARLVNGKPVSRYETRARMLALTSLDMGLRIQEMLNLRRPDVDLDSLVVRVNGKETSSDLYQ